MNNFFNTVSETNIIKRKKNSVYKRVEKSDPLSTVPNLVSKGQINVMQKFLEHTNVKGKNEDNSTIQSKTKQK